MLPAALDIPLDRITGFCQRHGIARLSLFGSVLRDDFTPQSDVDVLVEFQPGRTPDFFDMAHMQDELAAIFGHQVDLRTPRDLSKHFRDQVLAGAKVLHAA